MGCPSLEIVFILIIEKNNKIKAHQDDKLPWALTLIRSGSLAGQLNCSLNSILQEASRYRGNWQVINCLRTLRAEWEQVLMLMDRSCRGAKLSWLALLCKWNMNEALYFKLHFAVCNLCANFELVGKDGWIIPLLSILNLMSFKT